MISFISICAGSFGLLMTFGLLMMCFGGKNLSSNKEIPKWVKLLFIVYLAISGYGIAIFSIWKGVN